MPSKTSLFNKELIFQIGRSTGWVSIVYFLVLLFILPIRILMMYSDENNIMNYQHFDNLFKYDTPFQIGLMVIVPVLLTVFLFRFLQVKASTDLMHSLPIKRERIFHHYAFTGIVFLVLPVIVIALMILFLHSTIYISGWFSISDILYWAGTTILITLLLYTAGLFVAMMTGLTAVQAVLSYVFLFFPVGITILAFFNLKILLYGFPGDYFLSQQLEKMSPITYAAAIDSRVFHWKDAIIYTILSVILYALALLFYKKRKLESASEAIAFPKLRSVFKYGVTFCVMLLGGAYFNDVSLKSFGWTLFGYAAGAAVGYMVAEMVLQKNWRVFSHVKGLLVYCALIALLVMGVNALGIYKNRVPNEKEIKNVLMTSYVNVNNNDLYHKEFTPEPLKDRAVIEEVRKFHKQIISDQNINHGKNNDRTRNLYFVYELKNGNHVIREYQVNDLLYSDFLKPIYESKDYKTTTNEFFHLNVNSIKSINIRPNGPENKMVNLFKKEDLNEALGALRADLLAENYEDSIYYQNSGPAIEFEMGKDKYFSLEFKPTYQHLAEWLKKRNLLDQAIITADDISHVLIAKVDSNDMYDPGKVKTEVEKSGNSVDITDKSQINELLMKSAGSDSNLEYKAVFYYQKGHYSVVRYFDEDHLPEFIKSSLK